MRTASRRRIAQRSGAVTAATLLALTFTGDAWAGSFTTSMSGVRTGFESRRWTDDGGSGPTKIEFTTCTANGGQTPFSSTEVELWQDISMWPDGRRGVRTLTACKNGTAVGEYRAMEKGDKMYFRISKINGMESNISLSVKHVRVAY
ncbi:hypothetical protein GL263_15500 [Streptomyces durbertensis]|uniref:Uncharacterized protein n=1 Tax=Streptomyces durbertensis TaxID=2448886 RepID=A0ABR6EHZ7_9ACTN|nr:hypothetical protein [Streptomyces durbertensis]MBB1244961.1 hypothetical protein [Streptomyces durbertensis]